MTDEENKDIPKATKGDYIYGVVKGALAASPITGGIAAEILALAIAPPLQKRWEEWMKSIVARLSELEEKVEGFKIENLGKNPVFVTTLLQATQIALRTHQEEKLAALRNAVVNSALPGSLEDTKQMVFLNIIDSITPLHLLLLAYLDNPPLTFAAAGKKPPEGGLGSHFQNLTTLYPELRGQQNLCDVATTDLHNRGLVGPDSLHGIATMSGLLTPQATPLGKEFLKFVRTS